MKFMLLVFSCLLTLKSIQGHYWTDWYDQDRIYDVREIESLTEHKKLGYVCGGCKPIGAECRVMGSTSAFTRWSGTVQDRLMIQCLPTKGLFSLMPYQPDGTYNYEIRYLCPSTAGTWTSFLDRDNPTGIGDFENVAAFREDGINLCNGSRPMCANCRDTESLKHYNATGDKYETNFDCGWENGLICATHTNGKTCKDYEVKFKCPTIGTCPECAKWTPWLNREHGGLQDRELVGPEGHNPCSDHEPLDIQCRVRGTNQPWDQTGQKIRVKCTPSEGFACDIADQQIEQNCYDYEVRFLCP